jgi:hypothetical protein
MAANDLDRAQELLDKVPSLLDKKKIGGKDLPTEVYVRKKSKNPGRCQITMKLTHA